MPTGVKRGPYRDTLPKGGDGRRRDSNATECATEGCNRVMKRGTAPYCLPCARKVGRYKPRVNSRRARAHIIGLLFQGETLQHISERAGLSRNAALKIIRGGDERMISQDTERLILSVTDAVPQSRGVLPAWPYVRRLQSLRAAGHTVTDLMEWTGLSKTTILRSSRHSEAMMGVTPALAIKRAYDKHEFDPVKIPRREVREKGWVVPLVWEDIDNPKEYRGRQKPAPRLVWSDGEFRMDGSCLPHRRKREA